MKYINFKIKNFKGIKDAEISLKTIGGASVFAFVGLNESGKTTILEAMHSFSPDAATSELLGGGEEKGTPYQERVPRHLISEFTGHVSVSATVEVSEDDKRRMIKEILDTLKLTVDPDSLPSNVTFTKYQAYRDGDFISDHFECDAELKVKSAGQRKWRTPTSTETSKITDELYYFTPDIAYFPTFVFDFPEKFYLTPKGTVIDAFYRRVFQDILNYDGRGHTIEKDIIRRIRSPSLRISWASFLPLLAISDERDKILHVIDRASAVVTKVVFGRWNQIFKEQAGGKEIMITFETSEGTKDNGQGQVVTTNAHDVYVQFRVKDGTRRFNVNDRSLGFRWFFSFMLFTQFRVARSSGRPVLFLFDEPAANLHAAAQQKLIDCFPEIARDDHMLAYTTHSHYMIEPKWLEQTFIVTNRADTPSNSSVIDAISLDDESLDIKCSSYRSFVNQHPNQTDYFQPILDRLEVAPSRFDKKESSIVLEGRSDYYILRYASRLLGKTDLPLLPALGAGTFGNLITLSIGWNLDFLFMLDGDSQGVKEKDRYLRDYAVSGDRFITIDEFNPNVKVIEDLLDTPAINFIQSELSLSQSPSKNQIRRFFQERLAKDQIEEISPGFAATAGTILNAIKSRL
jgi:ABC-type Mn2+/Zn2+ transport system ATPase subunit